VPTPGDRAGDHEPPSAVPLPVWPAAWAGLALLATVVTGEIDRLVADVLDATGASWSFDDVFGPARTLAPWNGAQAWGAWESLGRTTTAALGSRADLVVRLLDLHLLVDLVFIAASTALGVRLLRGSWWAVRAVQGFALAGLVQDAVAFVIGRRIHGGGAAPGFLEHAIGLLTAARWVLAGSALVAAVLVGAGRAQAIRRQLVDPGGEPSAPSGPSGSSPSGRGGPGAGEGVPVRPVLLALWLQRFSLMALLPLTVMATGPGGETLDQLPDVVRSWVDGGPGPVYLAWAGVALLALITALFALGRLRSDRVWRERVRVAHPLRTPAPGLWALSAGLVSAFVVIARLAGAGVAWRPLVVVVLGTGLVLGGSWAASRSPRGRRIPVYAADPALARATVATGDVLSLGVGCVAGVGLARAFTAPAAAGDSVPGWLFLGVGTAVCVGVWPLGEALRSRLERRPGAGAGRAGRWLWEVLTPGEGLDTPTAQARGRTDVVRLRRGVRAGLAAGAGGLLLGLGLLPVRAAHTLGVLACAEFALTALVLLVGVLVVVSRDHVPLPLFRWLGLRTTPIAAVLVLGATIVSYQSGDATLHGVRGLGTPATASAAARPSLADTFAGWLSRSQACDLTVPTVPGGPTIRVRPMLLVAADGGGIRAAYWTASALAAIRDGGGACGARATLLSSGVSGGSLGLVLTQRTAQPVTSARRLSGQDALAAAGLGVLIRDNVAALTGVRLPSLAAAGLSGYPGDTWQDRAGLMEGIWQAEVPELASPFLAAHPDAMTGPLILNSTSVGTGCRVLVSQLRFPPSRASAATGAHDPACRAGASPLPSSFDLLADYGSPAGQARSGCVGELSAATAVMLSARFAFVTPSGVVGPCGTLASQQLIDGGYAESSGLGTVVDLADAGQARSGTNDDAAGWAGLVRRHNEQAMAQLLAATSAPASEATGGPAPAPGASPVFLAPVVVFLQNHFRSDITPATSAPSSELLVPNAGRAAGAAQRDTPSLLQRALSLTAVDAPCPTPADPQGLCAAVRAALHGRVPDPVIVVSPDTQPAVTAPLGWVLSRTSREGLDRTMTGQATTTCAAMSRRAPYRQSPDFQAGYGRLADLLAELRHTST
jgi:hypothetical protein